MPSYSALRFVSAWTKKQFISATSFRLYLYTILPIRHAPGCSSPRRNQCFISEMPVLCSPSFCHSYEDKLFQGTWEEIQKDCGKTSSTSATHPVQLWIIKKLTELSRLSGLQWSISVNEMGHALCGGPLQVMGPDCCSPVGMCAVWPWHCCLYWANAKM